MNALDVSKAAHKKWIDGELLAQDSIIDLAELLQKVWDKACESCPPRMKFKHGKGWIQLSNLPFQIDSL